MKTWSCVIVLLVLLWAVNKPSLAQTPATSTGAAKPAEAALADQTSRQTPESLEAEAAIRANAAKYVEAYNRRDTQTMALMWSPEAVYMDPRTGEGVMGREAIQAQFEHALAGQEDAKLAITIDSVDFVSPNVAIEKARAVVSYSGHPAEESTYSAVHIKRDGQWLIDRLSESDVPAPLPSNYEHLKPLEWMIGTWIDEDEKAGVQTDCEWTKNRNFITRAFSVSIGEEIDLSGIQIIGWDGSLAKIRSWAFDSDGGFSEGTWTNRDNSWIVHSAAVLPDGRKGSSMNIMKVLDDQTVSWQITGRDVDGEILPNLPEVKITRVKPGQ
jgi:uncharacterized protein (TIGR02246 family)